MNTFKTSVKAFLFMAILTGIVYPFCITLIGQLTMPKLANGSLLYRDNQIVGSLLLAQKTTNDRYFWPRPSAINYNPIEPSGGSNLGPTSQKLKEAVQERAKHLTNPLPELVYASGSGLDPHISLETALYQIPRIAKARAMSEEELEELVQTLIEGKQLGFLGPQYLNVLKINQVLDDKRRG